MASRRRTADPLGRQVDRPSSPRNGLAAGLRRYRVAVPARTRARASPRTPPSHGGIANRPNNQPSRLNGLERRRGTVPNLDLSTAPTERPSPRPRRSPLNRPSQNPSGPPRSYLVIASLQRIRPSVRPLLRPQRSRFNRPSQQPSEPPRSRLGIASLQPVSLLPVRLGERDTLPVAFRRRPCEDRRGWGDADVTEASVAAGTS